MENIEILKEKVRKDPNSKLFLPLAEAYKDQGLMEKSIKELLKGLKRQPEYYSARVALGKVYLRKKMVAEAQAEFEKVVKAVPDNLFAHKKLMDIYYNNGDFDNLEKVCEVILTLNEDDEDASAMLYAIRESREKEALAQKEQQDKGKEQKEDEKREARKDHPGEQIHTEDNEDTITLIEEEEKTEEPETEKETVSAPTFEEQGEEIESIEALEAESEEEVDETELPSEKHVILPTETMADICITQGLYYEAMRIYESILSKDPDNKKFLQRRSELKILLDLMESRKKEHKVRTLYNLADKLKEKS